MNFTITIGGREAIPVRAIPFITEWTMSPDKVAVVLAHDDLCFQTIRGEPIPLTAYHLVDGVPHPMLPKAWNGVCGRLKTLSSKLVADAWDSATRIATPLRTQAAEPCPEIGLAELLALSPEEREQYLMNASDDDPNANIRDAAHVLSRDQWEREAVKLLPSGAFVWRDEFEQSFHRAYKNVLIVEEKQGDRELDFSPLLAESNQTIVWEGFALANEQAQQHPAATEAPPATEQAMSECHDWSAGTKPRRRLDNLGRAVIDALNHLPPAPTVQQVFDYLVSKDDTGYIRGRDGDELTWQNGRGDLSRTSKKSLANRLPRLIREQKAAH